MSKFDVKPGDIVHIHHMYGELEYSDREGVVKSIDDIGQIHGSWGGLALNFDDDWEIISDYDARMTTESNEMILTITLSIEQGSIIHPFVKIYRF